MLWRCLFLSLLLLAPACATKAPPVLLQVPLELPQELHIPNWLMQSYAPLQEPLPEKPVFTIQEVRVYGPGEEDRVNEIDALCRECRIEALSIMAIIGWVASILATIFALLIGGGLLWWTKFLPRRAFF